MNLTASLALQHDKSVPQNVAVSQPKSGWALSSRLDWAMALKGVSHNAWAVAVTIAHHAGASTGLAWPGFSLIATESRLSRSAVIRAVAELERGGHLTIQRFKRGRVNAANRYRLPAMGSSAQGAPPSVCETPPPSVCETPEPVRTSEPVSKAARQRCAACGYSWPAEYGPDCYQCLKVKQDAPRRLRGLPTYAERPPRPDVPMTAQQTADAEDLAVENDWRQQGDGSWKLLRLQ